MTANPYRRGEFVRVIWAIMPGAAPGSIQRIESVSGASVFLEGYPGLPFPEAALEPYAQTAIGLRQGSQSEVPGYLVWCSTSGMPTVVHATFDAARNAAKRHAVANPGRRYHVMQSAGFFEIPKRDPTWISFERLNNEVPF